MMRWGQATRHAGKYLHTLYIHHGGVSTHTRIVPFSCSMKFSLEEISSALYVPGNKATTVDGVVSPYLDFSKQFEDVNLLEHSVFLRGMNVDIKEIVRKWLEWQELEKRRSDLEEKRVTLTKTMNALKKTKNKERISELKEHAKKIRNEAKAVTQKIWDLEEVAVIGALSLPSNLHDSTGSSDKLLFSISRKPVFGYHPKSHLDLGTRSEELEIMDNSPTAYYLKNRLALLELVCNDYFLTALNDQGFIMMLNSDLVKAAVMEGSGVHFRDRSQHNTLSTGIGHDTNHLHLVGGGSLQAFSAYFTKQIIEKSDHLPFKVMTAGRNYSPTGLSAHPGLLGCRQSSVVDGFILYEDVGVQEKTLLHETAVMLIESYLHFKIHFQVVQYGAKKLDAHESAAVGFLMFSPHTGQYYEVGRISLCGDYISRRLWTLCKKDKSASFVSMFHFRACHTARLLALLMENHQEQDGTYNLPECLQSAVDSL